MSKLRWFLEHMVVPVVPLLMIVVITYAFDLGGLRSNQLTNSINEIDSAIRFGTEYYGSIIPSADDALTKASDHKWAAIEFREEKKFSEAYSEVKKAREYLNKARKLGYDKIYAPREKSWWEGRF